MIYLVTTNKKLFNSSNYEVISVEKSLELLNKCNILQFDSETTGRDAHICDILCVQFGNDKYDFQMVVDATTIEIILYKKVLETIPIIGHNLKFDLQFLYNYGIVPLKVYDTMIIEQYIYLGYPSGQLSYSLKAVAERRLGVDIDKTVRGEIIWRGLDEDVIKYSAGDVLYLQKILNSQTSEIQNSRGTFAGVKLECDFVPVIAYLEWCGIKLDISKWQNKMGKDKKALENAVHNLETFVVNEPRLSKYWYIDKQGSLFDGFNDNPIITINWSSSQQVTEIAKILGFNTTVIDKKTGEEKDSVLEKQLSSQKGINDEFLKLYFDYQEHAKTVSSFGQGHIDSVNPKTGRIHTTFRQLGASSGRMSCGSSQNNDDLCKAKNLTRIVYPNIQQLPSDEDTRSSFIAEEGNVFCSADFSAEEARLAGDIYQDYAVINMFLEGHDSHSYYAKIFFKDELKDIDVNDVKEKRPDLRKKAKGPEFALNFGGGVDAIMSSIQCSREEAETILKNYEENFIGTIDFAKKGAKFVRNNGYIVINPVTQHRVTWWDWDYWKKVEEEFKSPSWSWDEYKQIHKPNRDDVFMKVKTHFQAVSKYERLARNSPCQGTAAIILKEAMTNFFHWIVDNGYFNVVKICALVHDEANIEYPEELKDTSKILVECMEKAAAKYCKSLPIPAVAEVSNHWIH